jgi:hypothetical protein
MHKERGLGPEPVMQKRDLLHPIVTMRILCLSLLLGFWGNAWAGEIDNLRTKQEVERFMIKRVGRQYKEIGLFDEKGVESGLENRFFRIDLDEDGLTDLIINGLRLLVVMDRGKGGYVPLARDGQMEEISRWEARGCRSEDFMKKLLNKSTTLIGN